NSATCSSIFTVDRGTMVASGPIDLTQCVGQKASFTTEASGSGPFVYQWSKDGVEIEGATNATYSIDSVTSTDAATYCVVVNGACNSVTNCASLTVGECTPLTSDTPQLNLQSGLFEQKVSLTNPSDIAFPAVRVWVRGLSDGAEVYNASGTEDGVPF